MPITLNGSGSINGLNPGGLPDSCVTTDDLADGAVSQVKRSQQLTLATAQNSTSGTSIDFTGIPSWAKRVTVMLNGVSTNGTSSLRIQLGTSGGIASSGYIGSASYVGGAGTGGAFFSSGFDSVGEGTAALERHGLLTFVNVSGNRWTSGGTYGSTSSTAAAVVWSINGSVTLSGTLDRIRITTVSGDTFDAGTINIMYE